MQIRKLVTFEDMGLMQWGVLNETETGVYSALALEEAFFTPLPEMLSEFIRERKAFWLWPTVWNKMNGNRPYLPGRSIR